MHRKIINKKATLMVLFMMFTVLTATAQKGIANHFLQTLRHQKTDSLQTEALLIWTDTENAGLYDSTYYPNQIIAIGQKEKNPDVEAIGQASLGYYFGINDNQPQALEHFLKAIQLGEKRNNPRIMLRLYNFMSYYSDVNKSIEYSQKVIALAKQTKELNWQIEATYQIGGVYFVLKQYDLALQYFQQAYNMNLQLKRKGKQTSDMDGIILSGLGQTFNKLHNSTLALAYFRLGLRASKTNDDYIKAFYGLATYFKEAHNVDSTFYYSSKMYKLAENSPLDRYKVLASKMLYEIYKQKGNTTNALKYHEIYMVANNSMNNIAKTKKLESLLMGEKERQKELTEKREQENEAHKNNLEYAAIALGLVSFVILFLLFSHSIIANQKLINSLGVVALLIAFELLNLFLHPYLGQLTHHSPIFMLLTMVCIAAILVPLHHKIEHWTVHKLVKKNKRIRLAAAKKTIEQLETEPQN
jgi:tetratricopeptide (TPR) repeat protein